MAAVATMRIDLRSKRQAWEGDQFSRSARSYRIISSESDPTLLQRTVADPRDERAGAEDPRLGVVEHRTDVALVEVRA